MGDDRATVNQAILWGVIMNLREARAKAGLSQELVDLHVTRSRYRPTRAQRAFSWGAWVLFAISLCIILLVALAINR